MSELPETPPQNPPTPRRAQGAWIILMVILFGMIGLQFMSYYAVAYFSTEKSFDLEEATLRYAIKSKSLLGKIDNQTSTLMKQQFQEVAKQVRADVDTYPQAAAIYAAASYEAGETEPLVLETLLESDKSNYQAIGMIYAREGMSEQEAQTLIAQISSDRFLNKLISVQAREKAGLPSERDQLISDTQLLTFSLTLLFVGGAGFVGTALWLGFIGLKLSNKLRPKGFPIPNMSPLDADRLAGRAAQFLGIFVVVLVGVTVAAMLVGSLLKQMPTEWLNLAAFIIIAAGMWAVSKTSIFGRELNLQVLGVNCKELKKNILWGIAAAAANLPLLLILALLGQTIFSNFPQVEHPVAKDLIKGVSFSTLVVSIALASLFAPFIEETLFRGCIAPAVGRVARSPIIGILFSGIAFAMVHPTGPPAWLPLAGIGAVAGLVTYMRGSLVPAMVMHGVHNFALLLFTQFIFS